MVSVEIMEHVVLMLSYVCLLQGQRGFTLSQLSAADSGVYEVHEATKTGGLLVEYIGISVKGDYR